MSDLSRPEIDYSFSSYSTEWRKRPRAGAVGPARARFVGGENGGDVFEAHVAAGYVEHGADEIAHHVVQKSVAADTIDEEMEAIGGLFVPRGGVDGANGGAGLSLNCRVFA